jgi:hypothetical protein
MHLEKIIHVGIRSCAAMLVLLLILSCQTGPSRPKADPALKELLNAKFVDNLSTWKVKSQDEQTVIDLLKIFKQGYETFDLSLIRPILSTDFEARCLISKDKYIPEKKELYLKARDAWVKSASVNRNIIYSIQDINVDQSGKFISIIALSTYQSRYFAPRFLETLIFEKGGSGFMLKQQTLIPLHQKYPELNPVEIVVGKKEANENFSQVFSKTALPEGVDAAIEKVVNKKPLQSGAVHVLVIFKEPPAVGSTIELSIDPISSSTYARSATVKQKVDVVSPYFVMSAYYNYGSPWVTGIDASVELDNIVVAKKKVIF